MTHNMDPSFGIDQTDFAVNFINICTTILNNINSHYQFARVLINCIVRG